MISKIDNGINEVLSRIMCKIGLSRRISAWHKSGNAVRKGQIMSGRSAHSDMDDHLVIIEL
jgi:hypothetical protein